MTALKKTKWKWEMERVIWDELFKTKCVGVILAQGPHAAQLDLRRAGPKIA